MVILKKESFYPQEVTYVFITGAPSSGEALVVCIHNGKLQQPPKLWRPQQLSIKTMVDTHLHVGYHVLLVAEAAQDLGLCWKELMEALDGNSP